MTDDLEPTPHAATAGPTTVAPDASSVAARRTIDRGIVARWLVLIGAVLAAYHHSLSTLLDSLGVDSPLAYLGLVPPMGAALIAATARPAVGELDVHDRYLDRMIATVGIVAALAVMIVLPTRLSTFFWMWRIDLLTLPLFVAAGIALLFGTRTLIRTKSGVLFLFLAWPLPFRQLLASFLDPFSSLTVKAVRALVGVIPVAQPVGAPGDAAFDIIGPSGARIHVVIATVCSGANSLLGFLLVAAAVLLVSSGPRRRKFWWAAFGAAVVWSLNLVRIMLILTMGKFWGGDLAIGVLHPYVGLVLFAAGVAFLTIWALPRFGIELGRPGVDRASLGAQVRTAVPRWRAGAAVLMVTGLVLGLLNASLVDVDPIASALGTPRLSRFEQVAVHLPGFDAHKVDHFDWTTRYFGEDSDWTRYEFAGDGTAELSSNIPVLADVITASDAQPFEDFGVEACYKFHGYDVSGVHEVDLGNGVIGSMLTWKDPRADISWETLFWYWAVNVNGTVRYQRIVLLLDADKASEFSSPKLSKRLTAQLGISVDRALQGGASAESGPIAHAEARRFLAAFGQRIVAVNAARATDPDRNPDGGA